MIHVECPSCAAPYDLDESRLPERGLKMRCPKCSATFVVRPDGTVGEATPARAAPKRTQMGVGAAPPPPNKGPRVALRSRAADADLPAPKKPDLTDLPAPRRPAGQADLPAPRRRAAAAASDVDLPAPKRRPPPPAPGSVDLPAPKAPTKRRRLAPSFGGGADLPAPKKARPPTLDVDLPAPKARPAPTPSDLELDLPAPKAAPPADLPAPKGAPPAMNLDLPAPKAPAADLELDLPAPKADPSDLDLDLPAPKAAAPALGLDLDLPAPKGAPSPDIGLDLPAPKAAAASDLELDLPAPKGAPTDLELDLPAPKSGLADLPAPKGAAPMDLELDLPAPKSAIDLPAPLGSVDLPAPREVTDLPGVQGSDLPDLGGLDLPAPRDDLDLPMPKGGAGLELDLPGVKIPSAGPPSGGATPFDDFAMDLPSLESDPPGGVEELELPDLPELPDARPRGGDGGLGLDLSLPEPRRRAPDPDPAPGAGGLAFGDIGGFSGEPAASLEFDELPEKEEDFEVDSDLDLPESLPPGAASPRSAPPSADAREVRDASPTTRRRGVSKGLIALAAVLMLIAGGGFALKFTPFGMFGVHFFEGFTSAAGSPASAEAALSDATDAAKDDSYAGGRAGLRVLSDARQREYVNRALLAGSAAREALFQVRFGEDSASEARERRILTRLETRGNDAPNMTLALAASALRSGDLAQARTLLGAAQGSGSLLGLIRGELALASGQHEAALESFGTLPDDDVRGLWGVARASMALDQGVDEALDAVLAANANHAGALVAKARRIANAQPDEARGLAERAAQRGEAAGSTAERAEAYALVGSIHETEGRRSDARRAFVAARTLVPFHVEALLGLGRLGLRERRFRDALTQYQAAQQAAAELTQPIEVEMLKADQAKLGAAQALIALDSPQEALTIMSALRATYGSRSDVALVHGRVLQKLEQTAEAAAAFEAAYAASPEFFEPYMAHAQLLSASGNDEAARAVLARARDTVEMTADVRRQLGDGSLAADDFDEAEREYRAALELESANVDALFGLGVALRSKRRYRSAEEVMEQLAAVDPGFPGLALERGRIFEALGQAERAAASFRSAFEADPENLDLRLRLGGALVAARQVDEAEEVLAPVAAERPDSAEVAYFKGRIAFARDDMSAALAELGRAVMLDGSVAEFHLYHGWTLLRSSQLGRASEEVRLAIELDDTIAEAFLVRGDIRVRSGRVDDAEDDFRRAIQLRPQLAAAHAGLGEALKQLGRRGDAQAALERAVAIDAERGEWWYRIGELRIDRGERRAAVPALERATALAAAVEERPAPVWAYESYRLLGDSLRGNAAANAYRAYLERSPPSALDRSQVERRLEGLR